MTLVLTSQPIGPGDSPTWRVQWPALHAAFPDATPQSTFICAVQTALANVQDPALNIRYTLTVHGTGEPINSNYWEGGQSIRGNPVFCVFAIQNGSGLPPDMDVKLTLSKQIVMAVDVALA